MEKFIEKKMNRNSWLFIILTACSVILIFTGLFLPPIGSLDNSVLIAVGEIFGFASLGTINMAINKGMHAEVSHGKTTLKLDGKDKDE